MDQPASAETPVEETAPLELISSVLKELVIVAVPALILAFLIHTFLLETTVVFGQSMEPELLPRQRLIVEKISYRLHPPQRGDMVVLDLAGERASLIKRVVGLPGEQVEIVDGVPLIEGVPLSEPYVQYGDLANAGPIQLAEDEYFVLGDNRPSSRDSRMFGPVSDRVVAGRAWLRYWPLHAVEVFGD